MTRKIFIRIFSFASLAVIISSVLCVSICSITIESISTISLIEEVFPYILIVLVAVLILSVVISYAIAKSIIKSIEKLGDSLENPNEITTYKELKPFVENIKTQNEKKKRLEKEKKQFTANVSHELKTPLTAIAGYAELIETGMAQPQDIKPFAHTIRKQALRLVSLAGDIIKLSQLEEEDATLTFEEVDIFDVATTVIETVTPVASSRDITINLYGKKAYIPANKTLVDELIFNLVDNAVRYNKDNGEIDVTIKTQEKDVTLIVSDTGIGIPDKYKDRIFERFFRVDKSRSKETGGTGLGLAIVKHIADVHGAKLDISSKENVGTTFTIVFKKL